MVWLAHYEPDTGVIRQKSLTRDLFEREGLRAALVEGIPYEEANGNVYYVDVHSRWGDEYGTPFVSLKKYPVDLRKIVTVDAIKRRRNTELHATDSFVDWPQDRPGAKEQRGRWGSYRQALRDLGRFTTVADMIAAWPVRPDGLDPIAPWRASASTQRTD